MKVGVPPFYETPAQLQEAIERYFNDENNKPFTITGVAFELGFESRQSFYDYEKKPEFAYIIKRARLVVENAYELNLQKGKPVGAIFALKNMGWKDQKEIDHTINPPAADLSKYTYEELQRLATGNTEASKD